MVTNFLEAAGTNGFLTAPVTLMTTELNTLVTATGAVSSVAGPFTQSSFLGAIWGQVHLVAGGAMSGSPSAGGFITGWFLYSPDGGSTFEKTVSNTDLPRTADFTIPLFASAYATGDVAPASGICRLPWWSTKVFLMNHSGVNLSASGNILKVGPVTVQY